MNRKQPRAIIIVLDGVGSGAMPDAAEYGDEGADTLTHVAQAIPAMRLPHLSQLGLGRVVPSIRPEGPSQPCGAYGRGRSLNKAKDTVSGHWEIAGFVQEPPFRTYPQGFPEDLVGRWRERCGFDGVLGNFVASGTVIIEELGERHLQTGWPILYTSADSVFQVAAHEEVIRLKRLYEICEVARDLLKPPHLVGRVIARPFVGKPGAFRRTENRRDFALIPSGKTLLDRLGEKGLPVVTVGKIDYIFSGKGISFSEHASNNPDALHRTLNHIRNGPEGGLIFSNLGDFDTLYGHRRDPRGFAEALEQFDTALPQILRALGREDIMFITGDHGCDPTLRRHTDHTREEVPILTAGEHIQRGRDAGLRSSLADLSATVCEALAQDLPGPGVSFWKDIISS